MSESFFGRFKGQFDSDLGGRYLSVILSELINSTPHKTLKALGLTELQGIHVNARVERGLSSKKEGYLHRRSDVSIFDTNGALRALIEVKYEDESLPGVLAQLTDYIRLCRAAKIPFIYLTKNPIDSSHQKILSKYGRATWLPLYTFTKRLSEYASQEQLIRMFIEFMQEEGGMFTENFNDKALTYYLVKSLAFPHAHGFGKLLAEERITIDVPGTLQRLLTNTSILADKIQQSVFTKCKGVKRASAIGGFHIKPFMSQAKLKAMLRDSGAEVDLSETIEHGNVMIWASVKLDSIWMDYGYYFDVHKGKGGTKSRIKKYAYAYLKINHHDIEGYADTPLSSFSEPLYYKKCLWSINGAIANILQHKQINSRAKRRLQELRRHVRGAAKQPLE